MGLLSSYPIDTPRYLAGLNSLDEVVRSPVGFLVPDVAADGTTDDAAELQAAIDAGETERRPVLIPGNCGISETLVLPTYAVLQGAGPSPENFSIGSRFVALAPMTVMVDATSACEIRGIGFNGDHQADYGVRWRGARPTGYNIDGTRLLKSTWLFDQTQNGTFVNLCSRFSAAGFTLANGARNNVFYNATSEVGDFYDHPTVPFDDACCVRFIIDEADADFTTPVVSAGNSNNRFFGGIHERAAKVVVFSNPSGFAGVQASVNYFNNVELTVSGDDPRVLTIETDADCGTLHLDGGEFILKDADNPFSSGDDGTVVFTGQYHFSGGANLRDRGCSLSNNLLSSLSFDTSQAGPNGMDFDIHGGGATTVTWNNTDRVFEVAGGNSVQGIGLEVDGAARSGNATASTNIVRGAQGVAKFTLSSIVGGSGQVRLYVIQSSSPFRRLIGSYAAGSHIVPIDFSNSIDGPGIAFTCNDVTSFKVKASLSFQ